MLTTENGELRPIQWRNFEKGVQRYQGEVVDKPLLMEIYTRKVKAARADRSLIESQDWSGVDSIIRLLINAFAE